MRALCDDRFEYGVGKRIPTSSVRPGGSLLDGEGGVEQQDAVLRPVRQIAGRGRVEPNAFVVLQVSEDCL